MISFILAPLAIIFGDFFAPAVDIITVVLFVFFQVFLWPLLILTKKYSIFNLYIGFLIIAKWKMYIKYVVCQWDNSVMMSNFDTDFDHLSKLEILERYKNCIAVHFSGSWLFYLNLLYILVFFYLIKILIQKSKFGQGINSRYKLWIEEVGKMKWLVLIPYFLMSFFFVLSFF